MPIFDHISSAFTGGLIIGVIIALAVTACMLMHEDDADHGLIDQASEPSNTQHPGPITMIEPKSRISWPWATVLLCAIMMASLIVYLIRSAT